MSFGANKIQHYRELRGLSQTELARRIGVLPSTISRIETGKRKLNQDYLMSISRVLGVAPGDLVVDAMKQVQVNQLILVGGTCALDSWRVDTPEAPAETIPVIPNGEFRTLDHIAYRVSDDHGGSLTPKGSYVICVPAYGARARLVDGDLVVVRSVEGRMERYTVARAVVDVRGEHVSINGEEIKVGGDNIATGLIVSVYNPIR